VIGIDGDEAWLRPINPIRRPIQRSVTKMGDLRWIDPA
jgi:hypothetical protein